MADVGSVSVGVVVHGGGLGAKLAATIRAAVIPVIKELNAELNKTNDRANKISDTGMIKLAASARKAAEAVRDVGHAYLEIEAISRAVTHDMVKDYDRIADAADRSAQRQIDAAARVAAANAAASAGPGPGSGGGGGNGPGNGRVDGRRRNGSTGTSGLLGILASVPGLNALAFVSQLTGPAALGIAEVGKSIQQLVQTGALLPAVLGSVVSSLAVLKVGTAGVGDTIKDMWTAMASGDPKQLEKANKELALLTPNAQSFVKALTSAQPEVKKLTESLQQNIFAGLDTGVKGFIDKTLPTFRKGGDAISSAWNNTFKELLRVGGSDESQSFLDKLFGNTATAQNNLNKAIQPLVTAFGTLIAEGSDFLPRIADGFTSLSTRFSNFVTTAAGDGRLDRWINEGLQAFNDLGSSILNIGKIFNDITGALGGGQTFLGWLSEATGKLHDFLSSADGQQKLSNFFDEARKTWGQLQPILADLGKAGLEVLKGFQEWGAIISPAIKAVADALTDMPGLITAVVTAFLGLKTIGGISSLLGISTAASGLAGLPGVATTAAGGIKAAFMRVGLGAALGLAGFTVGSNLLTPTDENGNAVNPTGGNLALGALSNIGGGAAAGAALGSVVPGVGTGIGALIGGTVGALKTLFEAVNQAIDANTAKIKELQQEQYDKDLKDPKKQEQQNAVDNKILAPLLAQPTIAASLLPKIQSGAVEGFTINAQGQVVNTKTGEVVPLPGNLTPPTNLPPPTPPKPPPPPPPADGTKYLDRTAPPMNFDNQAIQKTKTALDEIRTQVAQGFNGSITLTDPTPEIIARLRDLGVKITQLPNGKFTVDPVGLDAAVSKASSLNAQLGAFAGKTFTAKVAVSGTVSVPNAVNTPGGAAVGFKAAGGVFPGYAPGVDSILSWVSPGEGVLIPEAVRGIGGAGAVYRLNSMFRGGLSKSGYASGGIIPGFDDGGVQTGSPILPVADSTSELGVLLQIRDLLAGKGGNTAPLNSIADSTGQVATGVTGTGTGTTGAGGTGGKWADGTPRNPGYEMAAAAIQALGGDPAKFLGPAPGAAVAGGLPGVTGGSSIDALVAFARSGQVGPGVDPTNPLTKAIVTARGKKNGLDDGAIADLVGSVLSTGTFSGALDSTNSALVSSLLKNRGRLGLTSAPPAGAPGSSALGADPGLPGLDPGLSPGLPGLGAASAGTTSVFVVNWPGQPITGPGATGAPLGPDGLPIHGASGGAAPGPGGAANFPGKSILDAGMGAAGGAASDVAGSFISALFGDATNFKTGTPTGPGTTLNGLIHERNPLALASAFGLDVPDYTRAGGEGAVEKDPNKPSFDARGRMFSDTGTLIDRTMTDLQTAMKAQFDQQMAVLNQIKEQLGEKVVKPITTAGVTEGFEAVNQATFSQIGVEMGNTAGPIIAQAVSSAVASATQSASSQSAGSPGGALGGIVTGLFDEGGIMPSGTIGVNLSGSPERVLSPSQTAMFESGVRNGWSLQPQQQHQATTSGVIGNDTVGAEFFGVSQIPIIGTIVNLLVRVLLKMIGVEIEVRDTLDEMSKDVRQFRGDFQKFDASGRLFNDTSGLVDRSSTSEQAAADERIRILKIVIEALVKFIIEKIIVPIGKAVANAAIQAGASAAGAAVNTQAPGAGGIVSSLISSAGMAGVDIGADLFSTFMASLTPVLIDLVSEGLQSFLPDLTTSIFGGGLMAMLTAPITAIIDTFTQGFGGGLAGIFGGLLGGLAFDDGGVATGVGLMPKATIRPERVLNPNQTAVFERMVNALERGGANTMAGNRSVQTGDWHFHGADGVDQARDRLLSLLGGG